MTNCLFCQLLINSLTTVNESFYNIYLFFKREKQQIQQTMYDFGPETNDHFNYLCNYSLFFFTLPKY